MASMTINIPDQHVPRVVAALCKAGGIQDPAQHTAAKAKQILLKSIRDTVKNVELAELQAAAAAAVQEPDTDGIVG